MARVGGAFTVPDSDDQRAPHSLPVVPHVARARSDVARTSRDLSDGAADRRELVARTERDGARDAPVCARVGQLVGRARGHVRHGADGHLAPAARRRAAARAAPVELASLRLADARPRGPHHQPRCAARALRDARELRAAAGGQAVPRRRAAEPRRSRVLPTRVPVEPSLATSSSTSSSITSFTILEPSICINLHTRTLM